MLIGGSLDGSFQDFGSKWLFIAVWYMGNFVLLTVLFVQIKNIFLLANSNENNLYFLLAKVKEE